MICVYQSGTSLIFGHPKAMVSKAQTRIKKLCVEKATHFEKKIVTHEKIPF